MNFCDSVPKGLHCADALETHVPPHLFFPPSSTPLLDDDDSIHNTATTTTTQAAKMQLTMSREQAAYFMWKHCSNSVGKTYEISKAGSLTYLTSLLARDVAHPRAPTTVTCAAAVSTRVCFIPPRSGAND